MWAVPLYRGPAFMLCALAATEDADPQVATHISGLPVRDQRKVTALLELVANRGTPRNEQKCQKLTEHLFEFKPTDLQRIIWFYGGQRRIVMTHAFKKEKNRTPQREMQRAEALRSTYIQEGDR